MRHRPIISGVVTVIAWLGIGIGFTFLIFGFNDLQRRDLALTSTVAYQRNIIDLYKANGSAHEIDQQFKYLADFQKLFPISSSARPAVWKMIGGFVLIGLGFDVLKRPWVRSQSSSP